MNIKLTKQGKIILAVCVVLAIAVLFYLFRKKKNKPNTETAALVQPSVFPLKQGSQGKEVEQLQAYMVRQYGAVFNQFGVDGIWGPETNANAKQWLKRDTISEATYYKWELDKIKTTKFN